MEKTIKKIVNFLKSPILTSISGIFLVLSLVISIGFKKNLPFYLEPALFSAIVSGIPLFYLAIWRIIYNKGVSKISSALLISIAMISALSIGDIFAAGEIAFIMALGEILEDKTTDKAKKGLEKLINLTPIKARKIVDGKEFSVNAENILVDDILRVLPGETIPADGIIISGETSIDQSLITGESLPVEKNVGDEVFCGTVNRFGAFDIKVSKDGENSSLKKMIKLVKEAEDKKAPIQRIADRWASFLVPIAMTIAIISGIITKDISVAVTILVVFCPCALVLATPTAIMASIGQATKKGVIIKSGDAIEKLDKTSVFAFDKTGTITKGILKVCEFKKLCHNISTDELIKIAASAESKSEHPIGKAITLYAKENNVELYSTNDFKIESGKGLKCKISNDEIICGNEKYFLEQNISISENIKKEIELSKEKATITVFIAKNKNIIGSITLSDTIKSESEKAITELNKLNMETVLLSGDNEKAVKNISNEVGIKKYHAGLLPEDKVLIIESIINSNKCVCMVGDGINDAPALKTANIGIAMGTIGSDIAIEAADVAILGDDISKIVYLKKLARETVKTIKLSISLSLFINFVAIVLSLLKLLTPTTGALVHNAGSLFVILIAAKLYEKKI